MSGTNALDSRSSVLGAIANPDVVNPLRAISDATSAAKGVYDVRQQQANEAIGGILQQATGPDGTVDIGTAQALAAKAGPQVQMGMQTMLQNNSVLRGRQIEQGSALTSAGSRAVMTVMNDPSDGNVNQVIDGLNRMYPGQRSTWESERQAILALPVEQRRGYAYQKGIGLLEGHDAMLRSPYGSTVPTTLGDVQAPGTTTQATPYGPGGTTYGPGVTIGAPPGSTTEGGAFVSDGKGGRVWVPGHVPTRTIAPSGQPVPAPGSTAPPPATGDGNNPPPAAFLPGYNGRGTPSPPTPALANPANAGGGKRSDLGGGVQVASAGPVAPEVGAASPPSAAVPGDVSAILGGMQNARATPSGGTQTAQNYPPAGTVLSSPVIQTPQGPMIQSGPPMGTGELMKNDIQISNDASKEAYDQRLNLGFGEKALEALRMAKGYTGPGTGVASNMYAFLQAHDPTGAIPQGTMSETAWRQVLAKNLIQFAQNTGMKANTDLGLATQLEGNPNVDRMLGSANEHVLVERIGLARQKLAQSLEVPPPSGEGAVAKHVRTFANNTDPRGFAWELYTPEQQAAINKEVEGNKTASDKLHKAMGIAKRLGLNQQRLAPPPAAAPPPPTSTPVAPLAMTQPNPLAAYA